ncbi:LlaJI family restriction endonuclease [Citrobacter sp. Awk 2]|uniref:LlaJI family restriction endonuclease n=1 Tax=Citrobacter sp. Awk 2 TaxID=2963959 RepID=UPI002303BAF8|nr:LlaJI family restriction endonuclease [Citrobacter sp. Awk 2]MDA8504469.1 LlaJI family restriction endonuclease [Citrobacter sp. Awk 2]
MLPADILYLSDRTPVTDRSIPATVLDELRNRGLLAPDMQKIHFCGVMSFSGGLAVFLPRNNSSSRESQALSAHYLLRSLLKFYRDRDTGVFDGDAGTGLIGGESLSLATALIDDYQTNGLYVRRIRVDTTNSGKVVWPETIARGTAYPSPSGPVYIDSVTTRSRYLTDSETAKIHASVMRELYQVYGMLWTGTQGTPERLQNVPRPEGNVFSWVVHLRRELQFSYSERDIFLLRRLIMYLETGRGTGNGGVLIGVRKFHSLWEAMLDECLVGKYRVNNKLPIPVYRAGSDKFVPVANKNQRTDTVLHNAEKTHVAIIDAKYYDAKTPDSAPGWPDLVKQFFYQKALSYLVPVGTHITNHFIFPGTEKPLRAVHVAERGKVLVTEADCLSEYPPIHCHYQDPLELLRLYSTGEKLVELTREIFTVRKDSDYA